MGFDFGPVEGCCSGCCSCCCRGHAGCIGWLTGVLFWCCGAVGSNGISGSRRMRNPRQRRPDIRDRRLLVEPRNREKRLIPSAVGAGFFVTEDQVVEEFRGVGFLVECVSFLPLFLFLFLSLSLLLLLPSQSSLIIRNASIRRGPNMNLPSSPSAPSQPPNWH